MIYLVPNADCVCFNNNLRLFKGVKYVAPDLQNSMFNFLANDCYPLTLNLYEICRNFVNGSFAPKTCQHKTAEQDYNDSNNDNLNRQHEWGNSEVHFGKDYNKCYKDDYSKKDKTIKENNLKNGNNASENNPYNYSNNAGWFLSEEIKRENKFYKNACCCGGDVYVFLNFKPICNAAFHTIKFKNSEIAISLSENLTISIGEKILAEMPNYNLKFSHFETFNDFCFIYFLGARNFVAIIKGREIFYADYYDKIELLNDEFYFLTYLKDTLNHGKVCHISAKESEKYLVYLDDFDLNLKPEFLPHVFLDCLLAGNFKYCNALLSGGLKQSEPSEIANFFCEFDGFYPLDNLTFALIKKDAVAGIYKFEIENNEIVNISEI